MSYVKSRNLCGQRSWYTIIVWLRPNVVLTFTKWGTLQCNAVWIDLVSTPQLCGYMIISKVQLSCIKPLWRWNPRLCNWYTGCYAGKLGWFLPKSDLWWNSSSTYYIIGTCAATQKFDRAFNVSKSILVNPISTVSNDITAVDRFKWAALDKLASDSYLAVDVMELGLKQGIYIGAKNAHSRGDCRSLQLPTARSILLHVHIPTSKSTYCR
jgi:hypothetical protein